MTILRSRSAALALGAVVLALSCARPPKAIDTPPVMEAPAPQTLVGVLDLVIGDPRNAGGEQVNASLVEPGGKRTALVITRGQLDALGPAVRQPGTKVRVIGELLTVNGAPAVRVATISIAQ
jgi:hypothetical protein